MSSSKFPQTLVAYRVHRKVYDLMRCNDWVGMQWESFAHKDFNTKQEAIIYVESLKPQTTFFEKIWFNDYSTKLCKESISIVECKVTVRNSKELKKLTDSGSSLATCICHEVKCTNSYSFMDTETETVAIAHFENGILVFENIEEEEEIYEDEDNYVDSLLYAELAN